MSKPLFRERLFPSLGVHLALGLSAPMVFLAALPINSQLALVLGFTVPILLVLFANLIAPVIEVTDGNLRAGRMLVPLGAIGQAVTYSGEEARLQRGPKLSQDSQKLFRGDIDGVIRIEITDPEDPTDYLLISTRRGEELARALGANRT